MFVQHVAEKIKKPSFILSILTTMLSLTCLLSLSSLAVSREYDMDGDGSITIKDVSIILSRFGKTPSVSLGGDVNHDNKIDSADLALVLNGYGQLATDDPTTPTQAKLRWAPPKLTNPITITAKTGTAGETINMDTTKDYIIKMPSSKKGSVWLNGGHNVVLIGGYIEGQPDKDTSLYITKATGTVHIEGLLIDNKIAGAGDGISGSIKGTLQIQNTRVLNIKTDSGSNAGDRHGDLLQIWGNSDLTALNVKVDRFTGTTAGQGFMLRPNINHDATIPYDDPRKLTHINEIDLSNVDLYYNNKAQDPTSNGSAGDLLWWADRWDPYAKRADPVDCRTASKITLNNVYLGRTVEGAKPQDSVWPDPTDKVCPSKLSGNTVTWANSGLIASNGTSKTVFSGSATFAAPPGGEFVPDGVAGLNYKSPGYLSESSEVACSPTSSSYIFCDDFESGKILATKPKDQNIGKQYWDITACKRPNGESSVQVVDDPIRAGGKSVRYMVNDKDVIGTCDASDNARAATNLSPRGQLESQPDSKARFSNKEGNNDFYYTFGTYFPNDFVRLIPEYEMVTKDGKKVEQQKEKHVQIGQVFGQPYKGNPVLGINVIRNKNGTKYGGFDNLELQGTRKIVNGAPQVGVYWKSNKEISYGGKWEYVTLHVKLSTDPNVGFIELWYNGVPQTLLKEDGTDSGQTKLYAQTLYEHYTWDIAGTQYFDKDGKLIGTSDGTNRLYINSYRSAKLTGDVTLYHDDVKVGRTYESVKP